MYTSILFDKYMQVFHANIGNVLKRYNQTVTKKYILIKTVL